MLMIKKILIMMFKILMAKGADGDNGVEIDFDWSNPEDGIQCNFELKPKID